jgi:hypothetical protein
MAYGIPRPVWGTPFKCALQGAVQRIAGCYLSMAGDNQMWLWGLIDIQAA